MATAIERERRVIGRHEILQQKARRATKLLGFTFVCARARAVRVRSRVSAPGALPAKSRRAQRGSPVRARRTSRHTRHSSGRSRSAARFFSRVSSSSSSSTSISPRGSTIGSSATPNPRGVDGADEGALRTRRSMEGGSSAVLASSTSGSSRSPLCCCGERRSRGGLGTAVSAPPQPKSASRQLMTPWRRPSQHATNHGVGGKPLTSAASCASTPPARLRGEA
jgi:hypothetical protein